MNVSERSSPLEEEFLIIPSTPSSRSWDRNLLFVTFFDFPPPPKEKNQVSPVWSVFFLVSEN